MVDEDDERALDFEQELSVCYHNGVAYAVSQCVRGGTEVLRRESGGVWVRRGALGS